MKKIIGLIIITTVLISCFASGTKLCGDYRINRRAIRHCKSVDQLNYFMNRQFKCPECSWSRSIKNF